MEVLFEGYTKEQMAENIYCSADMCRVLGTALAADCTPPE